jgi:hypothetical protein
MNPRKPLTPAGPAPLANVHEVGPGEAVEGTPEGPVVRRRPARPAAGKPAARATKRAPAAADDEYVLTPGGRKHRSLVHAIEPGDTVQLRGERLQILKRDRTTIDCGAAPFHPKGRPLLPAAPLQTSAKRLMAGPTPALADGWITYASWTNNTGTPVSRFATTWTVPPAPTTDHDQTIFLFNGIQNSTMIYQPVLQWGRSAAGGGSRWSVASWYADGQTGQSFHSTLVDVQVGDVLTGVMTLTGQNTSGFSYNCEFTGIANTGLPISNVQELTWCNETLEVYDVTVASDYPNTAMTAMRSIDLRCGSTTPTFLWTVNNAVTDVGQHTTIINERVGGHGEVDLWYRSAPYWLAGFGSIAPGTSQDWWFSWGGNGDVGPQLIQAQPVEPSGQLVTVWTAESADAGGHLTYHATVRNDGAQAVHFQWRGGGR